MEPHGSKDQVLELEAQIEILKRRLDAKEIVNKELKETLKEVKEGKSASVELSQSQGDTHEDVAQWKQKLEAKTVIIDHLKSELKSSKDTISGLETEKQASVVQEEIKTLRQINETQQEKIINLTNELHAKALKIEKLRGDLEKAYAVPESKDGEDGEDKEWTDLGSATALRDELIKQKEKNKKLKAKFEAYKTKVAAYRTKKANEKMETEKENAMLLDKLLGQLNQRNEEINEVSRELSAKQDELEAYRIKEAEVLLKQKAENEEIIERLNQKQLEIKKLKTEKESLMGAVALIEDQTGITNMIDELANKSQTIDELKHEVRRKDEMIETISNQLARDMNGLLDEMNQLRQQKDEEIEEKNAEIEQLKAFITKRSRRRSSANNNGETNHNTNTTVEATTTEAPSTAIGSVLGWFKGAN